MTDTNIIHALQCCGVETNCRNCPLYEERSADCIYTVLKNALDLITCQQAEVERLKEQIVEVSKTIKSEAVKVFAARLKEEIRLDDDCDYNCRECCYECNDYVIAIDNLVKEMIGE